MLNYLKNEDGLINISKENIKPNNNDWVDLPNGSQIRHIDVGVFEVRPRMQSNKNIVLSCGIHGNETAPIEILSKLISQIVNGAVEPKVNLLFILGNPEAMKISVRFISINMNRLFAGAFKQYELNDKDRYELIRAERLEEVVSHFFENKTENQKLHLDLHTAIKPSFHKTFAIRPLNHKKMDKNSKQLLLAMGIEAVLQHNKPSTTFSYFSVKKFNAEAYTLELGKVKEFGENNPDDFAMAVRALTDIVIDNSFSKHDSRDLAEYKVVAEIIKQSDEFVFHVAENVKNFTAFPQGSLIAEDSDYNYRVAYQEESVVFPNVNVPIGQRVALMVAKLY